MREPDKKGLARRRAWELTQRLTPDQEAGLSGWLVNVPGAHAAWEYWGVGVVHLRDIPGIKLAHKHYPEAEYEFLIYSVDPTEGTPDPDKPPFPHLTPLDVQYQFHGVCDKEAVGLCELAVDEIMQGRISPDQDYRRAWKRFLGAKLLRLCGAPDGQHRRED